jgi:hypothetical protein
MFIPRLVAEDFRITNGNSIADYLYDMLRDFRIVVNSEAYDAFMDHKVGKEPYKASLLILYEKFVLKMFSLVDSEVFNPSRAGFGPFCIAIMKEG